MNWLRAVGQLGGRSDTGGADRQAAVHTAQLAGGRYSAATTVAAGNWIWKNCGGAGGLGVAGSVDVLSREGGAVHAGRCATAGSPRVSSARCWGSCCVLAGSGCWRGSSSDVRPESLRCAGGPWGGGEREENITVSALRL